MSASKVIDPTGQNQEIPESGNPKDSASLFVMAGLVLVYLVTRCLNLELLPPFVDELTFARRGFQIGQGVNPLSLTWAGHGPFFPWLESFGFEPVILAGRLIMVAAGLISLFLLFIIGRSLWDERVGLAAVAFYVFSPFTLFYNRIGMTESLQSMFMLAVLYLTLLLAGSPNPKRSGLWLAPALGILIGGSLLIKLNSLPVLGWCVVGLALGGGLRLLKISGKRFSLRVRVDWLKWLLAGVAIIIAGAIFSIQVLNPWGKTYLEADFPTFTAREILFSPFTTWLPNLVRYNLPNLLLYLTLPVAVFVFGALFTIFPNLSSKVSPERRRSAQRACIPLGVAVASFLPAFLYVANPYPRYLFTGVVPLFLVGGWFVSLLVQTFLKRARLEAGPRKLNKTPLLLVNVGLAVLLSLGSLPVFIGLVTDPPATPLPPLETWQFIKGEASGYNLAEVTTAIRKEALATPQKVQVVYIKPYLTGQNEWIYDEWVPEIYWYMLLYPQNGARIPANLDIPIEANYEPRYESIAGKIGTNIYNYSVFDLNLADRDKVVLAAVRGTTEQQEAWLKSNPEFKLISEYVGFPDGNRDYKLYKRSK